MTCCRVVPILIITLLGAALRFYGIGHQGIWYDESYTFALVKLPLGVMFGRIPHTESTPPLYYCCVWVWGRIFGFGAAGIRTFSAVCGTATIPVAYAAARKLLHGRRAALIAAALTAFNPLLIWYSQEARSYELLVLLSACTLLAFAYARERPAPLALALWTFTCCCALLTHYYAILLIIPEAAWLLYEHRYRRVVYAALSPIALIGLALLPLIHAQDANHMNDWIGRSPFGERLRQVIPLFLIGPQTPEGARVLANILEAGFTGKHFVVGEGGYASVAALPEAPDLAILACAAGEAAGHIHALAARGTRAAIAVGEVDDLAAVARESGVRVLGPHSFGIAVPRLGLNASLSHMAVPRGRVALLTQSASLARVVLDWAGPNGVGFSHIVGVGGNVVNFVLSYGMIYGHFGLPRLGVAGSGYGTAVGHQFTQAGGCVTRAGGRGDDLGAHSGSDP